MTAQWHKVESGSTIGNVKPSGGVVIRDEHYADLARITLELLNRQFLLHTDGLFGPTTHILQQADIVEANRCFEDIKANLNQTFEDVPAISSFDWPIASKSTSVHYTWASVCDGWKLVDTPNLSVIQERMPSSTQETRHKHLRVRQFFYVLRGELTLEVDGDINKLGPQQGLEISPGQAHQARNESASDVEFLVISDGISREDREEV